VERGGIQLLRIRDDGCGIHPQDLELALRHHATSKITSLEDLENIRSFGFRGEALPSIASVSRLTLTSRQAGAEMGWRVTSEGAGTITPPEPVSHPLGTTVEIRDLFFNTPARRKYLRTEKTEFHHLEEVVRRLALSRFEVDISLHHNGREVFSLRPAGRMKERENRVARVCGAAFIQQAIGIQGQGPEPRLSGWVGLPAFTRTQPTLQYFFVNGRVVRDSLVTHALRQAYQEVLSQGRYPAYVLHLEMDPGAVDVNVHPTKYEVRFREGRLIHDLIFRTLYRVLREVGPRADGWSEDAVECSMLPGQAPFTFLADRSESLEPPESEVREAVLGYNSLIPPKESGARDAVSLDLASRQIQCAPEEIAAPLLGQALARLQRRYILAENQQGLVLADIPASMQEILGRRMQRALEGDAEAVPCRPLLVPLSLRVPEPEAEAVEQTADTLQVLGYELRRTGPESLLVRQLPAYLGEVQVEVLVRAVLADLRAWWETNAPAREGIITLLAQHGAAFTPMGSTLSEMNSLLRDLEHLECCSRRHSGRSLWVQISTAELERFFLRPG
jgi:DNA mismatch repair protein MutL